MFGLGKIVEIDLSTGCIEWSEFSTQQVSRYLAGRGFNVWYLRHHLPQDAQPLGPENRIMFSCGLLTGTAAPTSARLHVNSLSPLTGLIGSSNVGGYVGARLRACGIQSLIVRGKAARPVYIYAEDNHVEIRDARSYWGLDTQTTQDRIRQALDNKGLKLLTIGPAGEQSTPIACIVSGKDHAAGRTGLGAVMGAKNLKALVVGGGKTGSGRRITPAARSAIDHYVRQIQASSEYGSLSKLGGAGWVQYADQKGIVGAYNYRQTGFADIEKTDGKHLKPYRTRSRGCYHCPVQCKAELNFNSGPHKGFKGARPEFEPMINFGARCGLSDIQAIVLLDNLCTRLGLDSISTAGAIAFAMDLYDRGILGPSDTGGLALTWGNADAMEILVRQMAQGHGFGGILAKGVREAACSIGKGSEAYAPHVKGLELTAYHPGAIHGTALGYAISSRGGDYSNVYPSLEHRWSRDRAAREFGIADAVDFQSVRGKGLLLRRSVLVNIVLDCLGLCRVPALTLIGSYDLVNEAALTSAITGLSISAADLFRSGERIACLERIFNNLRGADVNDDALPPMFSKSTHPRITTRDFEQMRTEYYAAMGWDEQGRPTLAKLAELEL
jgi:aldehyde:ferredoxin oxidoreductase